MLGFPTLTLLPFGSWERPVVLASSIEAMRLRREEGWQDVSLRDALWHFDGMSRLASARLRDFISEVRLSSLPLSRVRDEGLADIVRRALGDGRVSALQQGDAVAAPSATIEQRRLIREIEKQTPGRLSYSGRQYKLVADVDLSGLADRNYYEVVREEDARAVLDGIAKESGVLAETLHKVSERITRNWRPPFSQPDGLVLLRRTMAPQGQKPDPGPPMTPSQMAKLLGTIEISLVNGDGEPMAGEAWEIVLPDGSRRSGQLDENGQATATGIPSGSCGVTFPGLDPHAWSPSGSRPL